ncbi:MAG: gliding motility-associated C-terminal domain-containing protein [Bacteroidaceae bacterium]|nr:gliding motility-associated C-terminal domain-containing protein [Bacteroidaceae bacterium]
MKMRLLFLLILINVSIVSAYAQHTPEGGEEGGDTVRVSKLEFPNAFSPNGDGINDTYRAKPTSQNILEFKAFIFNRWGKIIFRFKDITDEWDGTDNGTPVKDGVYFLSCEAKGADKVEYKIRKDINVLRGYREITEGY